MRRSAALLAAAIAASVIGLSSCQQLFTTSLASSLARESLAIPAKLSTSEAADLAAQAKANDDQKLATALVDSLVKQIASTSDAATKASLEASAASAAITASGAGSAFTTILGLAASGDSSAITPQVQSDLLASVQAGASDNVLTALAYLDGGVDAASSGLGATEYLTAAMILAASVIPAGADLATWTPPASGEDPTFDSATALLKEAVTLAGSGSDAASLISDLGSQFGLS